MKRLLILITMLVCSCLSLAASAYTIRYHIHNDTNQPLILVEQVAAGVNSDMGGMLTIAPNGDQTWTLNLSSKTTDYAYQVNFKLASSNNETMCRLMAANDSVEPYQLDCGDSDYIVDHQDTSDSEDTSKIIHLNFHEYSYFKYLVGGIIIVVIQGLALYFLGHPAF